MEDQVIRKPKSGALTGAIVLYIIATIITLLSVLGIVISGFLYTISFILSIVAIVQNRVAAGIGMMIANLVTPFIIIGIAAVIGINTYDDAVKEAETIIEDQRVENLSYASNLNVYDVRSGYRDFFGDQEAYVTMSIKNNGDSTLSKIELTFYFKDQSGTVIYEDTFLPLYVSDFNLGNDKPMKPNYVIEDKSYSVDGMPSAWKEGSFDYEITDIKFYDEDQ